MRLTLIRSGGFGGLKMTVAEINTEALESARRNRLESLVNAAGFFALPPKFKTAAPQPDRFEYTLTIRETTGREHTVICDEQAAPANLATLITALIGTDY